MAFIDILHNLPEVRKPEEKKLSFGVKLKWSLIVLSSFFVLANIPLYGLASAALSRFEYLAILLGTDFGSIISLGIGPIVLASMILQLLVGAQIININLKDPEGKKYFQAMQKLLTIVFIIFEAVIYVLMRGLEAQPGFEFLVILQLFLGGILIVFMDDVVQKWGFGSGTSLFIAAGIGWRLFAQLFQFLTPQGTFEASGKVLVLITSITSGDTAGFSIALFSIIVTAILFMAVVWTQSLKVEIPLSFDRIRGYGIRWPLQFFYTGVLPVILVSALAANLQLVGSLVQNAVGHATFLGGFSNGQPISGFAFWIHSTPLLQYILTGSFRWIYALQAVFHVLFYVSFAIVFSYFWMKTSGQDASNQARNILHSGLSIPGFRKDERILESILNRYVTPLTIMSGAAVGLLASFADLMGALVGGTAILLAIMILYQLYQNIAQQHAVDMNPAMRGMFGL
jgi:preprotein translocase subunit SecY